MSDSGSNDALRRRLAYRRELSKIGGPFEFAAWAFTLTGLIMVFSRQFLHVDYSVYRPLGSLCLAAALGCWLVVFFRRRAWIKKNPFKG